MTNQENIEKAYLLGKEVNQLAVIAAIWMSVVPSSVVAEKLKIVFAMQCIEYIKSIGVALTQLNNFKKRKEFTFKL